ncbi:hypothetical protein F3Y22_tig00111832pilonHSYRG00110 [Hibiscus syriacus]|uniref:Uncharacterized protein n=1 Tax=Hibiscus syriacus TaxID=106335 RepID=A0A6A2YG89_HIBSY|nr:hypothetical protein F3Y22_tig00111832pilonHSYRG00110 [Hibiscus syriacus]
MLDNGRQRRAPMIYLFRELVAPGRLGDNIAAMDRLVVSTQRAAVHEKKER